MNNIQSSLLPQQKSDFDLISKNNRDEIYEGFIKNLLFVKTDNITDYVRKNYSVRLHSLPFNEILFFLNSFSKKLGYKKTLCPFTFERGQNVKEIMYLRIESDEKSLYLDFYSYSD